MTPRWTYVPPTDKGTYGDIALGEFRLWHWLSDHAPIPGGPARWAFAARGPR